MSVLCYYLWMTRRAPNGIQRLALAAVTIGALAGVGCSKDTEPADGQPGEIVFTDELGNSIVQCPPTDQNQALEVFAPPGADIQTICPL